MSDDIATLPVNKGEILDPAEAARVKPYVQAADADAAAETVAPNFWQNNKRLLLTAAAFFLLSLPFLDPILTKFTGNMFFTLLLKTIIFVVAIVIIGRI